MPDGYYSKEEEYADALQVASDAVISSIETDTEDGKKITDANDVNGNQITLSESGHFYKDSIELVFTTQKPCQIYYTLDGTSPDKTKKHYERPIMLKAKNRMQVYSLAAIGYYEDGTTTDVIVHTYFIDSDINSRFDTMVFSVRIDPDMLYNFEDGIFVEGKVRQEYIKDHPNEEINAGTPANYNVRGIESERPAYVEVFDEEGEMVISQNIGMRTYGGWSRASKQKSIKLFARSEYDSVNNDFDYPFFESVLTPEGKVAKEYKRLVLRNAGNDASFAFIRDELFQSLAKDAGFMDTEAVKPCALFINGEYYGCYWLHESYSNDYFVRHYGKTDGEYAVLEGGETYKAISDEPLDIQANEDYNAMYEYAYMDLTEDSIYHELCEKMDVENYLQYYAYQLYLENNDWPWNNYRTYRYYDNENVYVKEPPFDGKWRYLLHDIDFTSGLYGRSYTETAFEKLVTAYEAKNSDSPMFAALMQREDCKEYFLLRILEFMNGVLSQDLVKDKLEAMDDLRRNELSYLYESDKVEDWVKPDQLADRYDELLDYMGNRSDFLLDYFQNYYNLEGTYELSVKTPSLNGVKVNGYETRDDFKGIYYLDYSIVVEPIIVIGKVFDYWEVNGNTIYDEDLRITKEQVIDSKVEIVLHIKEPEDGKKIIISEFTSNGQDDYIVLFNPYSTPISTIGYQLSDDPMNPDKMILPKCIVKPESELKIVCENYTKLSALGQLYAPFSLKKGETIVLSYDNEVIDSVTVYGMKKNMCMKRNLVSGEFELKEKE